MTSKGIGVIAGLLCGVVATGCDGSDNNLSDQRLARFTKVVEATNPEDGGLSSRSVWLVKRSWAGHIKTAVFFGYVDNHKSCSEFANAYNETYPEVNYVCLY